MTERLDRQRSPDSSPALVVMVCSSADVSSGRASGRRPPSVYAAPKAAAIAGNMAGRAAS